jgi:hypothetical protein
VTKRELAAEALRLGKELGVAVDVARKNHAELTLLVEDLRERARVVPANGGAGSAEPAVAAATPPPAVELDRVAAGVRRATPAPRPPEAPSPLSGAAEPTVAASSARAPDAGGGRPRPHSPAKVTAYRLAPGKVLTTQRAYLKAGDAVAAADLAGGQRTIDLLLGKGVIEPR